MGLNLDATVTFTDHLTEKLVMKRVGFTVNCNISTTLKSAICKFLLRPHLDYGDIIHGQPSSATLSSKIESVQYNAALATTRTISGSSREKCSFELEQEHLLQTLDKAFFYKVLSKKSTSISMN